MAVGETKYCPKCNKTLDVSNFYKRIAISHILY